MVRHDGPFVDCGTPRQYLAANLLASGGESVVEPGAVVEGKLDRCVVWSDARVDAGEVAVVLHPRARPRHRPRAVTLRLRTLRLRWRRSWPQAASISVPRVRRTVAFTPPARSWSRNSRTRLAGEPRTA